jgi:transcriptional regulator
MKKCPLCKGKGFIKADLQLKILDLRKKGLTIRQIAELVGKSSTTVFYHISKDSK